MVIAADPQPRDLPGAPRRASARPAPSTLLAWLDTVMDPEVPVVSVVDLGIVRDVVWEQDEVVVTVTPTYSGCPATEVIAQAITEALHSRGVAKVRVQTRLSPAWTTDWLSAKGREALRGYGIAPPAAAAPGLTPIDIGALRQPAQAVACPRCASPRTRLLSQFGSTACKALYQCRDCLEPFDYFKPH